MSINKRPLHFAHSEGHTDLCYTEDGSQIITCGSDGDIRIWAGIDDTDPDSYCVGEGAFSVAQKGDDIYVCRDDGRVSILKYPEGQRNGTLTRFTAPATHITVGKNEPIIACVAEDFSVKVFASSQDVQCTEFSDLKGPALGVAISPKEDMIAASCGDGHIYIWKLDEKKLIKTIDGVPRTNSFTSAKVLCRVSFNSNGKYFAYPHDKEIIIANTENYEKVFSLSAENIQAPFSIVQFSPCGNFVAASATNGDICIWPCAPGSSAASVSHDQKYNVCALSWHPEEVGELIYCDVTGQIGSLEYIPSAGGSLMKTNDLDLNVATSEPETDKNDENVIALEKLKKDVLDEYHILNSPAGGSSGFPSRAETPERPSSPPCTLQAPFQPSSTPAMLSHRFMVFNEVGVVRLLNEEDETSSIDVLFHDATFYKNLYMKNHLNHTMASLSTAALAFACETPSKLVCIPLKAGTKEWSTELTELEEILCIAASASLIAVASNVRMLRVFTIFGTQRAVVSVPGPVVSMAAQNNYIFVVYHACTAHAKDQNLSGMLLHIDESNIMNKVMPLPITPQASLTWVGFTNVGSLATYDSAGILRICRLNSGAWIPACDTTIHVKGVSDTFFLVSVNETGQNVQVVHCRGTVYPAASPLPILVELQMQLPMCELDTTKTQLEDKLFRLSFFETDQPEKAYKEAAIKLFALACKNDLDDRALEILEVLNNSSLVNISIKYANKLGKPRLVEKMKELSRNIDGDYTATGNEKNTQNVSVRPSLHRMNKPRNEISQNVETPNLTSQLSATPELFTNNTMEDSQIRASDEPRQMNVASKTNPFKRSISNDHHQRNPLSLTNSYENNEDVIIISSDKEKSTRTTNKPIEKETFQIWFNSKKADLEKEHPTMSPSDIVKCALKLFKKQAEKRKASDDDEQNHLHHKQKQTKLSAFAFSKQ